MPQATSHSTDLRMTLSALRDLFRQIPSYVAAPDVPAGNYAAFGGGSHFVWIYPKRNLIAVIRWIDRPAANEFFSKLVSALKEPEGS